MRSLQSDRSSDFAPLRSDTSSGTARKVGLEIEFAGLSPEAATECVVRRLGGRDVRNAPGDWTIRNSAIGRISLYLDTAFRPETDSAVARMGIDMARSVVPMEIVTEPLPCTALPRIEALLNDLAAEGGHGGSESLFVGCGLHLNVDLADREEGSDLPRIALAYALLERWMRRRSPPEASRRLLPFVDPYPVDLVTEMARVGPGLERDGLFGLLSRHRVGRNHGLDLLPAWAAVAPESYQADGPEDEAVSARPTYHYRLPDCRIGDADWSLAYEWNRWRLIEIVAGRDDLLEPLCGHWLALRSAPLFPERSAWHDAVTKTLGGLSALAPVNGRVAGDA